MIYHIGDKFLVGDIEAKVFYINQGMAWLVPTEGNTHICIGRLDENGLSQNGLRAIAIMDVECQAV